MGTVMADLQAKREAIAAHLAGRDAAALARLDPAERAALDWRADELIEGFDPASPEPDDPDGARLHRLLRAHRELRADEDNVRLAERGEVFAPEDDA